MIDIASIQSYVESTRGQIIGKLENELSHLQAEHGKMASAGRGGSETWDHQLYSRLIARKRQLLATLS